MAQVGLDDLHFAILSEDTIVFCNICVKILRESSKSTLQLGAFFMPKRW
ncbi:hypothetical protein TSYNT_8230 [Tepidanaerobacter syntrophicus]|uniref:Uncharacterized protein n=1 Tax=Tepidanaerobacter syntrophicus TaxID=224999 RepID=A0A0U9HG78_9FIRM|nr:hypothetical protein TSYNT_8230 [Tepidanaerobacter syntrophicus]